MPDFTTKPRNSDERPEADFTLDGVRLIARRPKGQTLLDLAEMEGSGDTLGLVRAAKQFIDDCLVPESRDHINDRLADPDDDFDYDDLVPVLQWITEEFTRRPTTSPGASRPTARRTGRASTARSRSSQAPTPESSPATGS